MKKLTYLLILFMSFISCTQKDNVDNDKMMAEKNKAAANEKRMSEFYAQVINAHNTAMIDSFCTSDFVEHNPFPGYGTDREGLKKGMGDWIAAFPDMNVSIDMIKSWNDTVIAKFHMKGTNTGMFMGAPATDKNIDIYGVDIVVLRDGKATEHWGYTEEMKMMEQLGMGHEEPVTSAVEK